MLREQIITNWETLKKKLQLKSQELSQVKNELAQEKDWWDKWINDDDSTNSFIDKRIREAGILIAKTPDDYINSMTVDWVWEENRRGGGKKISITTNNHEKGALVLKLLSSYYRKLETE